MKVLLLSHNLEGGAGGAAYRVHKGLRNLGVDSQVLIQRHWDSSQSKDDDTVRAMPKNKFSKWLNPTWKQELDWRPLRAYYPDHDSGICFYTQWLPDSIPSQVAKLEPDLINLHWVSGGFLQIETLPKFKQPLIWTLHDMWAFTGGCDYSQGCDRYLNSCGACPYLRSHKTQDLSRQIWQRKAQAWKHLNLTIVTPSHWLAQCAQSSALLRNFRVKVIPNGLDTSQYKPINSKMARQLLGLPPDKLLILFGSWGHNRRKGGDLLQPALKRLSQAGWQEKVEVVIFGVTQPKVKPDLGFKAHYLGRLNDELSLALAYSAADVFVAPSLQDNLPTTVMEAIACGVPCVAFNIGGMPDLIEHQQNGYLARPYEIEDFTQGIAWVLGNSERHQHLAYRAREKAEQEFTLELQAKRYQALFEEVRG
ncbi:MAG: glycosyltransferase family 4 protein [Leptolyngbyaceae bacterium]|nr:glycosyltransferase family 4 protein [Leptolyngbyaceae bacterium]